MTLTQLLFSFKGRINRKPWWLASLGAGFAASLLTAILEAVARSAGETIVNPVTHQFEPTGIFGLAISLIALVNAWIAFALSVKRLHDRDRTGWWLIAPYIGLAIAISLAFAALSFPEGHREPWNTLGVFAFFGLAGLLLWLFYEIGFLRGTEGSNRFGADPLATPEVKS